MVWWTGINKVFYFCIPSMLMSCCFGAFHARFYFCSQKVLYKYTRHSYYLLTLTATTNTTTTTLLSASTTKGDREAGLRCEWVSWQNWAACLYLHAHIFLPLSLHCELYIPCRLTHQIVCVAVLQPCNTICPVESYPASGLVIYLFS